jgi:carbamoyltransferase
VAKAAARPLADGKVVGWFQGGAEFGPRALGQRSILAHPGVPGLREHINEHIRFREDSRPFAPSVLLEDASRFFDCADYGSPFMSLVFQVRPEWRQALVNVVHTDDSARLQTVTKEASPPYHRLLKAFANLTGLPVLLNTSLSVGLRVVRSLLRVDNA